MVLARAMPRDTFGLAACLARCRNEARCGKKQSEAGKGAKRPIVVEKSAEYARDADTRTRRPQQFSRTNQPPAVLRLESGRKHACSTPYIPATKHMSSSPLPPAISAPPAYDWQHAPHGAEVKVDKVVGRAGWLAPPGSPLVSGVMASLGDDDEGDESTEASTPGGDVGSDGFESGGAADEGLERETVMVSNPGFSAIPSAFARALPGSTVIGLGVNDPEVVVCLVGHSYFLMACVRSHGSAWHCASLRDESRRDAAAVRHCCRGGGVSCAHESPRGTPLSPRAYEYDEASTISMPFVVLCV